MTIDKKKFFSNYNINEEEFNLTELTWKDLERIYDDYNGKFEQLSQAARTVADAIRSAKGVHSIRYRVKDPEHLIAKIIRKKIKDRTRDINISTYLQEITDLIGIRALHLFKDDWFPIHEYIIKSWDLHEKPKTYTRQGDIVPDIYRDHTEVEQHEFGYRSVHYLIKTGPFKEQFIAEIQVRTIFEEGWSEIDHTIRYPYNLDNQTFNSFLQIFNRLAGNADEMGTYINYLKNEFELIDKRHTDELEEKNRIIEGLENEVSKISALGEKEKTKLLSEIKTLKDKVNTFPNTFLDTINLSSQPEQRFRLNPGQGQWIGGTEGVLGLPSTLYVNHPFAKVAQNQYNQAEQK